MRIPPIKKTPYGVLFIRAQRDCLGFPPRSENFAIEPLVHVCSISSLSGINAVRKSARTIQGFALWFLFPLQTYNKQAGNIGYLLVYSRPETLPKKKVTKCHVFLRGKNPRLHEQMRVRILTKKTLNRVLKYRAQRDSNPRPPGS